MDCNVYHAQPLDGSAKGFRFTSWEDFKTKSSELRNTYDQPVDEFEVYMIEGRNSTIDLWKMANITQGTLEIWFESFEDQTPTDQAKLSYLTGACGMQLSDAVKEMPDVDIRIGTMRDVAKEIFDEQYSTLIPEAVWGYIDYDKVARDRTTNGDYYAFYFNDQYYVVINSNSF